MKDKYHDTSCCAQTYTQNDTADDKTIWASFCHMGEKEDSGRRRYSQSDIYRVVQKNGITPVQLREQNFLFLNSNC